jgi:CRP/FNR family transcriptional regulator, anaerobic regulatory protein
VDSKSKCLKCPVRPLTTCGVVALADLEEWGALAEELSIPARSPIYRQGERTGFVYIVTDGVACLSRVLSNGSRHVFRFPIPGDLIGVLPNEARGESACAVTDLTVCRLSLEAYDKFMGRDDRMLRQLHGRASAELEAACEAMTMIGQGTAVEKVGWFLLHMGDRWGRITGDELDVPLPMTRSDIADHLGMTLETVSRTTTDLARRGIIEVSYRSVRILDPEKLKGLIPGSLDPQRRSVA